MPPPPPDLHAATFSPDAASLAATKLRRVGGLSKAATILVGLAALFSLLGVAMANQVSDDAETYLAGGSTDDEFLEAISPYVLVSFAQGLAVVASAVLVIIWMYRVAANHRALHRTGTWGPGWAIGGWFLPPLLYIIPYLMFRELWKASDPDVPPGGDWRSRPVAPVVTAWFVLYSVLPIAFLIAQSNDTFASIGADERDLAETIVDGQTSALLSGLVATAGAVAFIAMARGLTARHRRLTGEPG